MNILPVCTLTVYIYVYIYINVRYYNDKKIEYFMILYFNNNFIFNDFNRFNKIYHF